MAQKYQRCNIDDIKLLNEVKEGRADDPLFARLRGYEERLELVNRVHYLYAEVEEVVQRLFPYSIYDTTSPKFYLHYSTDENTRQLLQSHLIDDRVVKRNIGGKGLYPRLGIKGFLDSIAKLLIRDGKVFIAIDWGQLPPTFCGMIVPVWLRYLHGSTLTRLIDNLGTIKYVQQYNDIIAPSTHPSLKGMRFEFVDDEIFYSEYFERIAPVQASADLAKKSWNLYQKLTTKFGASTNPEDIRFETERTRYQSSYKLWREYHLARARIRKMFCLPVYKPFWSSTPEGLKYVSFTETYKVERLIEYVSFSNRLRNYLVEEFNFNIMRRIAKQNSLLETPRLIYAGNHPTEMELEGLRKDFMKGHLNYDELLKAVFRY